MSQSLVSVIVPVYNAEHYLLPCLKSLSAQSYSNIEVILVDDGSTDLSGKICDDYAASDSRFRVFHQKNGGPGPARNCGLENARGEWISFVDSDDEVHVDYLKLLLEAAESSGSDIAMCEYQKIEGNDPPQEVEDVSSFSVKIIDVDQAIKRMFADNDLAYMIVCAKIFKKSVFETIRFDKMICEDMDLLSRLLPTINQIAYLGKKLYFYYSRNGSITLTSGFRATQVLAHWKILEYYREHHPEYTEHAARSCLKTIVKYRRRKDPVPESVHKQIEAIKESCWEMAFPGHGLTREKVKLWVGINLPTIYRWLRRLKRNGYCLDD